MTLLFFYSILAAGQAAVDDTVKVANQLALAPELAQTWMSDSRVLIALLAAGIVAALLVKLKWSFSKVIGYVLYGALAVIWGWYVFSLGYWDGAMFLGKSASPSKTLIILKWVFAILFPIMTLICRPAPKKKGVKLRWGQFNMLVVVMCLAYAAALLMVNHWHLNLWADVVFFGLPLLYVLLLLAAAHVTAANLLMGVPAAVVASLVAVAAVRLSTAASIVFAIVIYAVLGIALIATIANLGGLLGLDKMPDAPSGWDHTATKLNYNALDDIRERNWKQQHGG